MEIEKAEKIQRGSRNWLIIGVLVVMILIMIIVVIIKFSLR